MPEPITTVTIGAAHCYPISENFQYSVLFATDGIEIDPRLFSTGRHPTCRWTAPFAGSYYLPYGIYLETGVGFRASAVWIDVNNLRDINRGEL